MTTASLRFDNRQIQLIIKSLPGGVDPRKKQLLPKILKEWADNDLNWSLHRVHPTVVKERAKRMKAIAKHARDLSGALNEFEDYADDSWLPYELSKRIYFMGSQDEVSGQRQ